MLVGDLLVRQAQNDRPAILAGEDVLTYRDLHHQSRGLSRRLASHDVSANVGVLLPNGIAFAVSYFGIALAGRTVVPLHVQSNDQELAQTLHLCDVTTVVTDELGAARLAALSEVCALPLTTCVFPGGGCVALRPGGPGAPLDPEGRDVAVLLATSGTTGGVKRVMLTHDNLLANISSNVRSLGLTEGDRALITLPMTFGYCHTAQFLTHIALGASIVIHQGVFLPAAVLACAERYGVTNTTMVPSMLMLMLRYPPRALPALRALRLLCFGGGPIAASALRELMALLPHVGLVQTYGQTEASPRLTALLPEDAPRKLGSVGRPIPDVRLRVVDPAGADVAPGAMGEVIAAGPNIMKGYHRAPDQTREVLRGGWLHTGDLGYVDDEGFLFLVGRQRNTIIRGGVNVAAEEIEAVLLTHPDVAEARVQGEPHPLWGEAIRAEVVLRGAATATPETLLGHCADHLARHKVPDRLDFIEHLPRTTTGKVQRAPPVRPPGPSTLPAPTQEGI